VWGTRRQVYCKKEREFFLAFHFRPFEIKSGALTDSQPMFRAAIFFNSKFQLLQVLMYILFSFWKIIAFLLHLLPPFLLVSAARERLTAEICLQID
jgi:hypothetical protein